MKDSLVLPEAIDKERKEFNKKIRTKLENGFSPDIRKMQKNPYFIKQFWRDPYLVNLALGKVLSKYQKILTDYVGQGAKILDVGCGAGYLSLELARMGFHVTAIDIADEAIAAAQAALDSAEKGSNFGSLNYRTTLFSADQFEAQDKFDAVVFSASLHHFPNIEEAVSLAFSLCRPQGIVLAHEPARVVQSEEDSVALTLFRAALSITGNWYSNGPASAANSEADFQREVLAVLAESSENKDEFNPEGQSESDDMGSGARIYAALSEQGELLLCEPTYAFLNNGLGGLRGVDDATIHKLADLLAVFESYALSKGIIHPNAEIYVAKAN